MVSKKIRAAILTLLLTGCATTTLTKDIEPLSPELQKEVDTPLYCEGETSCKEVWDRAVYYVNNNAGFKLQIMNDNVIETYNPPRDSEKLGYRVYKEPLGDNKYRVWTQVICNNMFGCTPHQVEAMARAKRYMRTGKK